MRGLLLFALIFSFFSCKTGKYSGIKPYSKKPNYWEYEGKPILLYGGSEHDNLFQLADEGQNLEDQLNILKRCGGNYVRCTMSSRKNTPEGLRWDLLPYPYQMVNGKYDLTLWNDVYWNKLYRFLKETQKRGIIVQISLWDRWNESGNSEQRNNGWYYSPYNPNNNINYDWNESPLLKKGKTKFYNDFHYAAVSKDSVLLPVQQRFIEKIIDLVIGNHFKNVLFQVDNDSGIEGEQIEADSYWANYIREYGKLKNVDHPVSVCIQRRFHWPSPYLTENFQDWNNPEIREPIVNPAFNYCDISQNNGNSGQEHYDNFIWYRSKANEHGARPINNIKCFHLNWPTGADFHDGRNSPSDREALSKFRRLIFAGAASAHFPDSGQQTKGEIKEGFGLTNQGQFYLKGMSMFLKSVNIYLMEPNNGILSGRTENEAYCLAENGKQYSVFFTGEGDCIVEIDLGTTSEQYKIKWLDVDNNRWSSSKPVNEPCITSLSPPDSGSLWVAVITNTKNQKKKQVK